MTAAPEPKKILLIMLRRIGDVILTIPAVKALRRRFPRARIDFLVEPPAHEVLAWNPDLSRILVYSKGAVNYLKWLSRVRRERYDWVVDFMGNPRTAMLTYASGAALRAGPARVSHNWAYSLRLEQPGRTLYGPLEKIRMLAQTGFPLDESSPVPSLDFDPAADLVADASLKKLGLDRRLLIGLVPASRRATRRWPAASYAELGRRLRDKAGAHLIVFWGPGEKALARGIRDAIGEKAALAPETKTLAHLAGLMSRCRIVVTNCNGPKHIAVGLGVPTLTIHGSSDPRSWNPPEIPRHPFIRKETLACIGCRSNSCPTKIECMNELEVDEVYEAALKLYADSGRAAA